MTLTRKSLSRKIGQRTRLTNQQAELMLETLIDLCTEELGQGGRISLDNFLILEVVWIQHSGGGQLQHGQSQFSITAGYRATLKARPGKKLHDLIRQNTPQPRDSD